MARATSDQPTPGSLADQQPEADPEQVARTIVLRRLALAPRTRSDLAKDLAKREVPDDVSVRVLDRFEELGYVNDADFADAWVQSRHANRGSARSVLRRELRERGVADERIDSALETISDEDERERAVEFARARFRRLERYERAVQERRLASALARRGYPSSMCWSVTRQVIEETNITSE
jgi:regulatory protein